MSENIANRSTRYYTSDMEKVVVMMEVDASMFPVTWQHMDDDTVCDRHQVCDRDTYVRGGRIGFGSTLAE